MKQRTYTIITMCIVILLTAVMIGVAMSWPKADASQGYGPAIYPIIVMIGIIISAATVILKTLWKEKETEEKADLSWEKLRPCLRLFAGIALYALLLKTLGFVICNALFLFVNMLLNKTTLKINMTITVVLTAVLFALFKIVLKVPLPGGYLGF